MKKIEIDLKHPLLRSEDEPGNDLEEHQGALADFENKKRLLGEVGDY